MKWWHLCNGNGFLVFSLVNIYVLNYIEILIAFSYTSISQCYYTQSLVKMPLYCRQWRQIRLCVRQISIWFVSAWDERQHCFPVDAFRVVTLYALSHKAVDQQQICCWQVQVLLGQIMPVLCTSHFYCQTNSVQPQKTVLHLLLFEITTLTQLKHDTLAATPAFCIRNTDIQDNGNNTRC